MVALAALTGVSAIVMTGCAAEGEEEEGPQFPHAQPQREERPIGAAGTPQEDAVEAQGAIYGQGQPAYGPRSVTIGNEGDGAYPSDGPQAAQDDEYADSDPSALTDFRAALDPYGEWVEDPSYGTIWRPSVSAVGNDFAPYETAGHWSYGDDYTWVSDYSWGWAPFHYGRWVYATNGWGWIPGRQYAGAWTSWRTGYGEYGGYVGWAPLPPTWYWRGGSAVGIGIVPPAAYGFTRSGNLFASSLQGRMMTGPQVATIGAHSSPVTHGASGARALAHPEVAGPSPASLHIAGQSVTRTPSRNAGITHARQFAHPSTAVALGAHAPAGWSGGARGGSFGAGAGATGRYARLSETRTLGGIGGAGVNDRGYLGGHAVSGFGSYGGGRTGGFGSAYYGHGGVGSVGAYHGGGVHGGVVPAPQNHPQYYGGGYHAPSSGGSSGGSFHGGGHGGGGHGGGHR